MDKKTYYKEIKLFFTEIDWNKAATDRLEKLTDQLVDHYLKSKEEKIVYVDRLIWRTQYITKPVKKDQHIGFHNIANINDLNETALEICEFFDINPTQLKVNNKESEYFPLRKRSKLYILARATFAKTVLDRKVDTRYKTISDYLGYRDHTSVMHLLYYSKSKTSPLKKKDETVTELSDAV